MVSVSKWLLKSNLSFFLTFLIINLDITLPALAAQSVPSSMTVKVGTFNGLVGNLAKAQEGKIVNLYTDVNGNLSTLFKFSAANLSSSLSLNARFMQFTGSNVFTFQFKNNLGAFVNVGSKSGSASSYTTLNYALPAEAVVGGIITIRLKSSSGSDDCNLDSLAVADSVAVTPPPTVAPAPVISSFGASPASIVVGQSSKLSWSISNATSILLDPGSINVTGLSSYVVSPSTSTTYKLTAVNSAGSIVQSLLVDVTASVGAAASVPAGTKGYLQLQGILNTTRAAKVYDIDMYDHSASEFASLKQAGHTVICYFSAGSYENWRIDADQFPAAAIGNSLAGWAGENWLDIRNTTVRTIMTQRMDLAKSKGCDGIDPDNVDGYSNNSGFPLTMQDQINFNTFLADQAHARGLTIGLKNSTALVDALVSKFDFAVVEECFQYNECSAYSPFISQNKAVFNAEYSPYSSAICTQAASLGFSTVFYNLILDGTVYNPCP